MTFQAGFVLDVLTSGELAELREDAATSCSTSRLLSPRKNDLDHAQRTTKAVGKQAKQQVLIKWYPDLSHLMKSAAD